jgi:hypothetical protein
MADSGAIMGAMPELTEQQIIQAAELLREDGWKASNHAELLRAVLAAPPEARAVGYMSMRKLPGRRTPPCGWAVSAPPALVAAARDAIECVR